MRRLLLMRHAKSDYPHGVGDHDRPLNRRGRLAAPLMAAWLREENAVPDLAFVSSAVRARETWTRMAMDGPAETREALYLFSASTILAQAKSAPDDARTLLVLCHQPGIEDCADRLLDGERVDGYPTAKIAAITFDASRWRDIDFRAGTLLWEASPKTIV